jgi:2-oxoisovalerate dehydrogenase E1 component
VAIASWANGLWRSLRAARTLRREHGIAARVLDLRWLVPLDVDALCDAGHAAGNLLVVDEGRRTGGTSEAILTALIEHYPERFEGPLPRLARYCGEDSFIPLGPSWRHVLPHEDGIVERALALCRGGAHDHAAPSAPGGSGGER